MFNELRSDFTNKEKDTKIQLNMLRIYECIISLDFVISNEYITIENEIKSFAKQ